MSDELFMQIAQTLASLDRRLARLEVGEASSGTAGTASMTAAEILTAIKTVDGTGSGLDADLLDGSHATAFSGTAHTHTSYVGTATYTAADVLAKLLTVDGTSSLLDADKLDGLEGSAYSGTAHTHTAYAGTADVTAGTILAKLLTVDGTGSLLDADKLDGLEGSAYSGTAHTHTGYVGTASYTAADVLSKLLTVDGTASLLDADLLDGLHASAFVGTASYTAADVLAKLLTVDGATSGLDADYLDGLSSIYFLPAGSYTASDVFSKVTGLDGPGSGLNADFVDGYEAADLAKLTGATFTGPVRYSSARIEYAFFSLDASSSGGFARYYGFNKQADGTPIGAYGAYGSLDAIQYYYIGPAYNNYLVKIQADGKVGIGTIAPQGILHAHDGTVGCGVFSKTAVNTTAQVVIPDGTGDVTKSVQVEWIAHNGTTADNGGSTITPGGAVITITIGSDTYVIRCNANGSLDVRRTAGSNNGTIALKLFWI